RWPAPPNTISCHFWDVRRAERSRPGEKATMRGRSLDYKWLVLIVLLPGMTVITVDLTVVNGALAKLGAGFAIGVDTVRWALPAYALATGIATPLAGYVENRFTLKPVWIAGFSVFTGASIVCGLAPAFWVLVLGRLAQGFAAGLLLP